MTTSKNPPLKMMCHGAPTLRIATQFGWLPGARYTNLRDVRSYNEVGLVDIDWKNYDFAKHLEAVAAIRPRVTIAQDIQCISHLESILKQAEQLARWACNVAIVPKDEQLIGNVGRLIPCSYLLGYSVPTKYGGTRIPLSEFRNHRVHLLGGRPDVQRRLSADLDVYSIDGNRITLDARYGDYFTGYRFKRHPKGGYYNCIAESLASISELWGDV